MDAVNNFFQSITPDAFNGTNFLKFVAFYVIGSLVISILGRVFWGKRSLLNSSVSCAMSILCIYVVNIIVYSTGIQLEAILSPLPFVEITGEYLVIHNLLGSSFSTVCSLLLDMLILAFLVGLLDSWLPQGKNLFTWFAFRILSVVLAICLHYVILLILGAVFPNGFFEIAPQILLVVVVVALLLGLLKPLVGGVLTFFSPVLGILYTFFFSNLVGKQISKAVFSTAILAGLVCLLNYLGVAAVFIGSAVLIAYLPLLLLVLGLWYVISHLL